MEADLLPDYKCRHGRRCVSVWVSVCMCVLSLTIDPGSPGAQAHTGDCGPSADTELWPLESSATGPDNITATHTY